MPGLLPGPQAHLPALLQPGHQVAHEAQRIGKGQQQERLLQLAAAHAAHLRRARQVEQSGRWSLRLPSVPSTLSQCLAVSTHSVHSPAGAPQLKTPSLTTRSTCALGDRPSSSGLAAGGLARGLRALSCNEHRGQPAVKQGAGG